MRTAPPCLLLAVGILLALAIPAAQVVAQTGPRPRDTTMINRSGNPILSSFRFRSIGPVNGGRIDDIAVYEKAVAAWFRADWGDSFLQGCP